MTRRYPDLGITSNRVRTDFWIQNSRVFKTFFQNNNFFFQTQGYQIGQWSIETLTTQVQSFFNDALQKNGRDRIRFDQNKNKFIDKALAAFKKKTKQNKTEHKLKAFTIFKTLSLFSRLYPGLEIARQISRLFQEFKTLYEPCSNT